MEFLNSSQEKMTFRRLPECLKNFLLIFFFFFAPNPRHDRTNLFRYWIRCFFFFFLTTGAFLWNRRPYRIPAFHCLRLVIGSFYWDTCCLICITCLLFRADRGTSSGCGPYRLVSKVWLDWHHENHKKNPDFFFEK